MDSYKREGGDGGVLILLPHLVNFIFTWTCNLMLLKVNAMIGKIIIAICETIFWERPEHKSYHNILKSMTDKIY